MNAQPLTRQQLLQMMGGFRVSCILGAAAELDLWTALGDAPLTAAALAERLHADLRAITTLLDALAALGTLEKSGDRYQTPEDLKVWLRSDGADTIVPMLRHNMSMLRAWQQLAYVAKSGIPGPRTASINGFEADRAAFIAAMHTVSGPMADELVARLMPLDFRRVIDVGGASGTWTMALLRAVPEATAVIFDLPDAIRQAKARLSGTVFASRVELVAGDFYRDELPGGNDYAWVSAIIHQHSRKHNVELFAKVHRALVPGGRIGIRDIVMESDRTLPLEGALFAVNMLSATQSGGTFTFEELAADLVAAGFRDPTLRVKDAWMNSVVEAQR